MEVLDAWGVPVLIGKLEDLDMYSVLEYVTTQKFEENISIAQGGGAVNEGDQTVNRHLLDDEGMEHVRAQILLAANAYAKALGHDVDGLFVSNSWAVKINSYDQILPHCHTNCYFSGVLYLTSGQPLHLHRPWTDSDMFTFNPNVSINPDNVLTQPTRQFYPQSGGIIIMPSNLHHSVQANLNNKVDARYSIAFNLLPKGKFGHNGNYIYLKEPEHDG